jgi:hypothetical protein
MGRAPADFGQVPDFGPEPIARPWSANILRGRTFCFIGTYKNAGFLASETGALALGRDNEPERQRGDPAGAYDAALV